jgi:hypothetical protein
VARDQRHCTKDLPGHRKMQQENNVVVLRFAITYRGHAWWDVRLLG